MRMLALLPRPRLLPLTIIVMVLLLGVKTVDLLGQLLAFSTTGPLLAAAVAATAEPPGQPPAKPAVAAPEGPVADGVTKAASSTPIGTPPISDNERAVLLDLRQRRVVLDAREAQIAAREKLLAAAGERLATRVDELTALQTSLQSLQAARRQRDELNWAGLVKTYETMKPRDAAQIFNDLDMAVLLPVMDRMKESKAAPILAAMDPVRARALTARIAESRVNANTPATSGGG